MTLVTLGIDLGKTVCSLVGMDETGAVIMRKRLRRDRLVSYTANLERCVIAMEACCGAHYLGRTFLAQGHEVRLIAPEYARPYVKSHKNDDWDAEGVAEASTRPSMRFVALKSETQLDVQSLHRVRHRLVRHRTALINQLRAILLERGITVAKGPHRLARELPEILADEANGLSPRLRLLIEDLQSEWRGLTERIKAFEKEFRALAKTEEAPRRLMTIPGFGPLNATALAAAVGNGSGLPNGRALAASLGLVPRQMSTGGKQRLGRISKRGNPYVRTLLIHGARAALPHLMKSETPLGHWLRALRQRHGYNVVTVALANKMARIAWVVLARGETFTAQAAPAG